VGLVALIATATVFVDSISTIHSNFNFSLVAQLTTIVISAHLREVFAKLLFVGDYLTD